MVEFDLVQEPRGDTLRRLIVAATETCDRFTFERSGMRLSERAMNVLTDLAPYLIGCEETTETPGSSLPWGTVTLCTYRLTAEAGAILGGAADGLYDWAEPELPQDLCFLRGSAAWLLNLATDRMAMIDVPRAEADALRARDPGLRLRERPSTSASTG